jgi:phytoene synthase
MTALGAARSDLDAVEAIVRAAGTSFHRGMAILPPDRRHAMYAIYAFCRIVDDIVDEPGALADKRRDLDAWRARIAALYENHADDLPVSRMLLLAIRAYGLRQEDFIAVIDGMQMDGESDIIAPDLAALDLYCDRVAAAVGRLSVRAFGDASPQADVVAHHLGRALQLTNVLRDIAEDAGRNRVYLPREFFTKPPATAAAALADPALPDICARVSIMAHNHFRAAATAMDKCDRRAMRPARLMGATYAAILRHLERRGWERLDVPVKLAKWEKIWLLLRYGLR